MPCNSYECESKIAVRKGGLIFPFNVINSVGGGCGTERYVKEFGFKSRARGNKTSRSKQLLQVSKSTPGHSHH